jgi:hypothetical protein
LAEIIRFPVLFGLLSEFLFSFFLLPLGHHHLHDLPADFPTAAELPLSESYPPRAPSALLLIETNGHSHSGTGRLVSALYLLSC